MVNVGKNVLILSMIKRYKKKILPKSHNPLILKIIEIVQQIQIINHRLVLIQVEILQQRNKQRNKTLLHPTFVIKTAKINLDLV